MMSYYHIRLLGWFLVAGLLATVARLLGAEDAALRAGTLAPRATQTNVNGVIEIAFAAQAGGPFPDTALVDTGAAVPAESPVRFVTLQVLVRDATPSELRLSLPCRGGRQWMYTLQPPTRGVWTRYTVPVTFEAGWSIGPWKTAGLFAADRTEILGCAVQVARSAGTAAQRIAVADVALLGDDWAGLDSDGDGMRNAAELDAGTDQYDRNSLLTMRASEAEPEQAGYGVCWDSVAGKRYAVWRTEDLARGVWTCVAAGIQAAPPQNCYFDVEADEATLYFYKVNLELNP